MNAIDGLLKVSETYRAGRKISASRLSTIVFDDGKVLPQLAQGERDITTRRLESAIQWFSDHWPAATPWPAGIARPEPRAVAEPAEAVS